MKGIALAIETIVFIILAVTVLSVLLFFFTSTGGQAQHEFELQQQRQMYCGRYANIDTACEQSGFDKVVQHDVPLNAKDKILPNILDACSKLRISPQHCGSISLACVQACCIQCPIKPA